MAFVVVYDANVLYPNTLRDMLIRIGQAGLVQAKWTHQILDEVFENLVENRPDLKPETLTRTRQLNHRHAEPEGFPVGGVERLEHRGKTSRQVRRGSD